MIDSTYFNTMKEQDLELYNAYRLVGFRSKLAEVKRMIKALSLHSEHNTEIENKRLAAAKLIVSKGAVKLPGKNNKYDQSSHWVRKA